MRVSSITFYPIKSCAGTSLNQSEIGPRGIKFDREWMLTSPDGKFFTQRDLPSMSLIKPILNGQGGLSITAPGMPALPVPAEIENPAVWVTVWKDSVQAIDQGDQAADWFSAFLGLPCRLVRMAKDFRRPVDPDYAVSGIDQVGFADGYPVLLISDSSLADLNTRLEQPLEMNRFRPNITVSGTEAFAEDSWRKVQIGNVLFHVVKPCARCIITTVNQSNAVKGVEPLKTLATYRNFQNKILFGQNLIPSQQGILRLGDEVLIR